MYRNTDLLNIECKCKCKMLAAIEALMTYPKYSFDLLRYNNNVCYQKVYSDDDRRMALFSLLQA